MNDDDHHPIGSSFEVGRSISNGFAAVRAASGPLWLGGFLMWITESCGGSGGLPGDFSKLLDDEESAALLAPLSDWVSSSMGASFLSFGDPEMVGVIVGIVVAIVIFGLIVGLALFALHCWLEPGFIRLQAHVLEHASDSTAPLFSGKDVFWPSMGWNALDRLALSAAFCVGVWPGALLGFIGWRIDSETWQIAGVGFALLIALPAMVYVGLGTFLGAHAVVLEGRGPVHALRRSWALARGNRFPLLFFAFVCMLLEIASALGILLCCVGLLLTVPFAVAITGFARTEGFLLLTRGMEASRDWKLWHGQLVEDHAGAVAGASSAPAQPAATTPPGAPADAAPTAPAAGPAAGAAPATAPAPTADRPAPSSDASGVPRGWAGHLQPPEGSDDPDDEPER